MPTFAGWLARALSLGALVLFPSVCAIAATVTLGSLSQTYDGAPKRATATTSPASLDVAFTYDTSPTPPTAAGTYAVVATITTSGQSGTASGSLVIAKAAATVTLDTASLAATYDGSAKSAAVTTQPLGLTVNVTYGGSSTAPTVPGSYAVLATVSDANYSGTASGTLVISQGSSLITYGALPATFFGETTFTVSASATSGATVAFSVPSGTSSVSGTTVTVADGTPFTLRASAAATTFYNAAPDADLRLTAGLTNPTITFGALANKTVGDAAFALSATVSNGLTPTFAVQSGPATISGGTVTVTGPGTVTIRADQAGDTLNNPAPSVYQSFTVAKKSQTIAFGTLADKTYGDAAFTVSATSSESLPVSFTVVSGPATISGSTVTLQGAGTVTLRAWQTGDTTRAAASTVDQSFTVAKKTLAVTAQNASRGVGATNPAFALTYSGLVGSDQASELTTQPAASTTATTSSVAGTYPITVSGGSATNYSFSYTAGTLTVTQNAQTITFGTLAGKTYGDAAITLGATASSGLTVSYRIVSGPASVSGNTLTITGAGTVVVEASQAGDSTYTAATAVQQSFTVSPKILTVTAVSATRDYGAANPTLSVSYSGFVSGEGVANLTTAPTASTTATTSSAPGTYPITASGGSAANYSFSYSAGTLTVAQAAETITFGTLAGKTYGDAAFTLGATASSGLGVSYRIVSGPATVSGSTLTITGAGTVVVEASQAGDANYTAATAVQQSFTVSPKTLTVTAANATRGYGAVNPTFTVSYSGFVSGEGVANLTTAPTASTAATTASAPGTYPITASGGSATNYSFSYVAGTLTVTQAAQTITFGTLVAKTYGDAALTLGATASSGLGVSYRIVSGPATVSGSTLTITGTGTVVVEAS